MSFSDDLRAAKNAEAPHEDVPVLLNGHAHTLRFRQMNGYEWQLEVDKNPQRPDTPVDMATGYNARGVVLAIAPKTGVLLDGSKEIPLRVDPYDDAMTDEEKAARVDEWADLLATVSGPDFGSISDAIWRLNDRQPGIDLDRAVEQVKKARSRSSKATD